MPPKQQITIATKNERSGASEDATQITKTDQNHHPKKLGRSKSFRPTTTTAISTAISTTSTTNIAMDKAPTLPRRKKAPPRRTVSHSKLELPQSVLEKLIHMEQQKQQQQREQQQRQQDEPSNKKDKPPATPRRRRCHQEENEESDYDNDNDNDNESNKEPLTLGKMSNESNHHNDDAENTIAPATTSQEIATAKSKSKEEQQQEQYAKECEPPVALQQTETITTETSQKMTSEPVLVHSSFYYCRERNCTSNTKETLLKPQLQQKNEDEADDTHNDSMEKGTLSLPLLSTCTTTAAATTSSEKMPKSNKCFAIIPNNARMKLRRLLLVIVANEANNRTRRRGMIIAVGVLLCLAMMYYHWRILSFFE